MRNFSSVLLLLSMPALYAQSFNSHSSILNKREQPR